jgi:hypothetical protein
VGWLLLRPYRRITQLGGKDGTRAIASAGRWHRRFFRDMREAAKMDIAEGGGTREPTMGKNGRTVYADQSNLRPEARLEDPAHSSRRELESTRNGGREVVPAQARPDGTESVHDDVPVRTDEKPRRELTGPARPRRTTTWTEPDVSEQPASYAIYRPETGNTTREPATPRVRSEAK